MRDGDSCACEAVVESGGGVDVCLGFYELRDGRITSGVEYWVGERSSERPPWREAFSELTGASPRRDDRPEPVPDLDWSSQRARAFADGAVELWQELLERLPSLPVAQPLREADVRTAVAIDVPEAGLNGNVGAWRLAPATTEIELQLTR